MSVAVRSSFESRADSGSFTSPLDASAAPATGCSWCSGARVEAVVAEASSAWPAFAFVIEPAIRQQFVKSIPVYSLAPTAASFFSGAAWFCSRVM